MVYENREIFRLRKEMENIKEMLENHPDSTVLLENYKFSKDRYERFAGKKKTCEDCQKLVYHSTGTARDWCQFLREYRYCKSRICDQFTPL